VPVQAGLGNQYPYLPFHSSSRGKTFTTEAQRKINFSKNKRYKKGLNAFGLAFFLLCPDLSVPSVPLW
jgi:hypothetical protein